MKRFIPLVLSAVIFPACYFVLLDYVRPILEERNLRLVWWVLLGTFLVGLFAFQFGAACIQRPIFFGLGFVFLSGTVYTYDPSINVHLAAESLGWLWAAFLMGLFVWLYIYVAGVRRSLPEPKAK